MNDTRDDDLADMPTGKLSKHDPSREFASRVKYLQCVEQMCWVRTPPSLTP